MCSGSGIEFDGIGSWNFCYDDTRNVVIFGVDNSSSSHADNLMVLDEEPTYVILGIFGEAEKILLEFTLQPWWWLFDGRKSVSLRPIMRMLTFQLSIV